MEKSSSPGNQVGWLFWLVCLDLKWESKGPGTAREKSGSFRLRKSGSKGLGVTPKQNQQDVARVTDVGALLIGVVLSFCCLVTSGCWLGQPETGAFPVPRRAPGSEPAISRFFCLILATGVKFRQEEQGWVQAPNSRAPRLPGSLVGSEPELTKARVPGGRPGRTWLGEDEQEAAVRGCCSLPVLCAGTGPSARWFQKGSHSHTAKTSTTYS